MRSVPRTFHAAHANCFFVFPGAATASKLDQTGLGCDVKSSVSCIQALSLLQTPRISGILVHGRRISIGETEPFGELPIADVDFGGSDPRIAAVTRWWRGRGGCSGLPQFLKPPLPFCLAQAPNEVGRKLKNERR